jgi:hypothetical protein
VETSEGRNRTRSTKQIYKSASQCFNSVQNKCLRKTLLRE